MSLPAYLFLYDENGMQVNGGSLASGREGKGREGKGL